MHTCIVLYDILDKIICFCYLCGHDQRKLWIKLTLLYLHNDYTILWVYSVVWDIMGFNWKKHDTIANDQPRPAVRVNDIHLTLNICYNFKKSVCCTK